MKNTLSPWSAAIAGLDDPDRIKSACLRQSPPLGWKRKMSGDEAARLIGHCLSAIYVPTAGAVDAIGKIIRIVAGIVDERYSSQSSYLEKVNALNFEVEPGPIICLTGLAGIGKSALLAALSQLLEQKEDIKIPGHGMRVHRPLIPIRIGDKWGEQEIARQMGFGVRPSINLGRALFAQGTVLVTQDELQFMAVGGESHARQAKLLYMLAKLGPVALAGMNYSLIHKLKKRPQEERDRILREPIILTPDTAESPDWLDLMKAWDVALTEYLSFSLVDMAADFWGLCIGIKRSGIRLLELAAMHAIARCEKIAWKDVMSAFASTTFSVMREDIEVLSATDGSKTILQRDLVCPFESEAEVEYRIAVRSAQRKSFFTSAASEALPKLQREALQKIGAIPSQESAPRKPRLKRDAKSLIEAGIAYQNT